MERKEQPRWMKSMIEESKKHNVTLSWHRSERAAKRAALLEQTKRQARA